MSSIFLSYAGIDRPAATRIKNGLQAAGAPMIWQDTDQIKVGDNWIDVLQRTLEDCSAYVILVGTGGIHRWVKAELSYALKRHYDSDGQFPIYPLLLPGVVPEKDLPPFLSLIQAQTLASLTPDPTEFQHLAERLQVASEQAETESITPIVSPIVSNTCPWPGLESFDEDTARFYFGRQQETAEALALFGSTQDGVYRRWLQIDGPSGVGKSSLAKAGLLPAIRRGWVEARGGSDPKGWLIAVMRPGADPVFNLAEALKVLPGAPDLGERVHKLRGDDPDALRYLLREYTPAKQRFLLLVDQLEELFTLVEDPAQQRRFDALLNAVLRDQDGGFHLITTIRSDFMTRFSALPKLETLLNERAARYYLKPVTETGLRDAIRTPARLGGLGWDVAKLPDRIFDDAQENSISLPLVSYCLQQLWEKRSSDNKLLDSVYYDLGGVGGALAHSADEVLNSFDKTGRDRARQLLLALVKVNRDGAANTRRRISRDDALTAAGGGPQAEHILMRLSGGVTPEGSNKPSPRLLMVPSKEAGDEQSPAVVELA
ncbi:MAG: TIR domain-containing protein, partial [Candidatus Competibacteraceae bacterium]|nr:TIR domain-containing protein [Candidatus Competibacteraceae bacterium]